MEWIKIIWKHDDENFPFELYIELDDDRYNIRKIEFFKNGKVGFAFDEIEFNDVGLIEGKFPSVEEYNELNKIY